MLDLMKLLTAFRQLQGTVLTVYDIVYYWNQEYIRGTLAGIYLTNETFTIYTV